MGDYQDRITILSTEQAELEASRRDVLAAIGEYVYLHRESLFLDAEEPAVETVHEAADRLRGVEARLREVEESQRREASIKQEIGNTQARIRALEEEMDPLFVEIGRSAFEVFKDNPFIDPPYAELFRELHGEVNALEEVDLELAEEEQDIGDKPFLDRMLSKGKVTWLKSRKQSREHALEKHFRKAGRRIVGTDFVEVVEDPGLNAATKPYKRQRQRIETFQEKIRTLEADLAHHREELSEKTSLPGNASLSDLRQQRRKLDEKLQEARRDLARRYLKVAKKAEVPEAIGEEAEEARRLERSITAKNREIAKLRKALRKKSLEEEVSTLERRAGELREQAEQLEKKRQEIIEEIETLSAPPAGPKKSK